MTSAPALLAASALGLVALAVPTANAQLLADGFESYSSGSLPEGWTTNDAGGGVPFAVRPSGAGFPFVAYDGDQFLVTSTSGDSTVYSNELTLAAGTTFAVSFFAMSFGEGEITSLFSSGNDFPADIGETTNVATIPATTNPSEAVYSEVAYTVGPFESETTAYFTLTASSITFFYGIDNLTISAVTEGHPADFNGDGEVTVQDLLAYLSAFRSRDSAADVDGAEGITVQDLLVFLSTFRNR